MVAKGEEIDSAAVTLGRSDQGPNNVSASIRATNEVTGEVYAVVTGRARNSPSELPAEFVGNIGESGHLTLPADVIRENDLHPGHRIRIDIHEVTEEETFEFDDPEFEHAGSATVQADNNISDGCQPRLEDEESYRAINRSQRAKLVNMKNEKSAETVLKSSNNSDNRLNSFDHNTRRQLGAEPGDEIKVYADTSAEFVDDRESEPDIEQRIKEIHEMLSELHTMATDD